MRSYTYGYDVYINNKYDAPEEHHIESISKTNQDIYILSKLMDESLQDFPMLFFDKMIKYWMFKYFKVVSQLSNVLKQNKESDDTESMLIAREKRKNILSHVHFF